MLAIIEGHERPEDWASLAWRVLAPQGQRLLRDRKILETDEENPAELTFHTDDYEDWHEADQARQAKGPLFRIAAHGTLAV